MQTCHVFAGTHKTGSTALQQFLATNADRLATVGHSVIGVGFDHRGHRALARSLADGGGDLLARFAAELTSVDGNAVLASELFGDVIDKPPMPDLLLQVLAGAGYRARFVLVIRPQADYFNSRYAQLVKQLRCDLAFAEWVDTQLRIHRFDYQAHFGQLFDDDRFDCVALPFDAALRTRGIVATALDVLGVTDLDPGTVDPGAVSSNRIPGQRTIEHLLALQRARPGIAGMGAAERRAVAIEANAEAAANGWDADRFNGLTTALRLRIEGHYATSNDAFAHAAWGRSWADVFAP